MKGVFRLYPSMMLYALWGHTAAEGGILVIVTMLNFMDDAAISPTDERLKSYSKMGPKRLEKLIQELIRTGALIQLPDGDIYTAVADRMKCQAEADRSRPAIPLTLKNAVFERDGMVCVYCDDTEGPFELDHRLPWSRGGEHSLENLCVACRDCNRAKYNLTEGEFING